MTHPFSKALAISAALLLGASSSNAQAVDIGLFRNGSELEVRLRPSENFDGLVSSLVFTVRWDRTSNATLGEFRQVAPAANYIPTRKSGARHEDGTYNYQIFAGISLETLSSTGSTFEAGKEYTVGTIRCTGDASFEIVNDQWTGQLQNNGNYYLALNGRDLSGVVYKSAERMNGGEVLSINPNPSQGLFNVVIPVNAGDNLRYEVLNAAGQVVLERTPNVEGGTYREQMDLTRFGAGNYNLRIFRNGTSESHKLLITN